MRKLHIRRVTETITYIETVMVEAGTRLAYFERDGRDHQRYRASDPVVHVDEAWRVATEVEALLQGQPSHRVAREG